MEKILVSIIIPVYNVENYIDKCIKSVIDQSYKNFELILIDDGSTDTSNKICDNWELIDKRIKTIHVKNNGASYARNIGINYAKGEYIIFLDSDDYWLNNNCLKLIVDRIENTYPDVLIFNFKKICDGKISRPYFQNIKSMKIDFTNTESKLYICQNELWTACPWNKIIRSELFKHDNLDFEIGRTSEDIVWCAQLLNIAQIFDYVDYSIVGYVIRHESTSRTVTRDKVICLQENIFKVIQMLEISKNNEIMLRYISYLVGIYLLNLSYLNNSDKNIDLYEKSDELAKYLKYSNNRKIKLMNIIYIFGGVKSLLFLLKKFNKIKNKGD